MDKRGPIVLLPDTAGFIALTMAGVGLFCLELGRIPLSGEHVVVFCIVSLCIAVTALLVSRIIEVVVYTVTREGVPLRAVNARPALPGGDGVCVEP